MRKILPQGAREWLFLAVGLASGILGTLLCAEHVRGHQIPDNLPGLLSAGVGLVAVFVGARTYERWEVRHRKEKRAEAAAEAIMAAMDATELLHSAVRAASMCLAANDRESCSDVVSALRNEDVTKRLLAARSRVAAYMPYNCARAFERIWSRKKSMDLVLSSFASGAVISQEYLNGMFGTQGEVDVAAELALVQELFGQFVLPP